MSGFPTASSASSLLSSVPGAQIPPGWGSFIAPKLKAAGSAVATINVVGDSVATGLWASNLLTTSWPGRLKTAFQNAYGNGGSGITTCGYETAIFTALGGLGSYYSTIPNNLWTATGTWSGPNGSYGPGMGYAENSTASATLTIPFTGTTMQLFYADLGGASFTYKIDSGTTQTVTINGTSNPLTVTVTGLSAGAHTVLITAPASGGCFIGGVSGTNSSGVILNNQNCIGVASVVANNAGTVPQVGGIWLGGYEYPADLVIYSLGINDMHTGVTADTFIQNVQKYLAGVLDNVQFGGSAIGNTDLMFVLPHLGQWDVPDQLRSEYEARLDAVARSLNAIYVNMNTVGRHSWNYWNSLNYWGSATNPATSGTDTIHPSDAGHKAMADTIINAINVGLYANQGLPQALVAP